jgi:multicomponent Na+:H+ antiporter subunit F
MDTFFRVITVALVLIMFMSFYRVLYGPSVFDRLLAIGAIASKTIGLICLLGLLYNRLDMFIDIALAYAILNFITGIAVAKFFARNVESDD